MLEFNINKAFEEGKRGIERPKKKWMENIKEDFERYQISVIDGKTLITGKI